ncbi:unnamed protein product [Heligmosomoides polygyrus]|uniref:Uncharacterized protein n=1 Tax=Heligmosomoides polygyrus TaxID=6339 RepID=A0A183GII3_HELPZ|nr:unnamed protein product [Heligmosomoides polygyrus]
MSSSTFEDELTSRRLNDSMYRNVLNMDRSVELTDLARNRRCYSASRSRPIASALHEFTPKSTKIPTLMSRSLSASCERSRILHGNLFDSPIACGSREQLCEEIIDAKWEARQLLERSRTRQQIRVGGYEARCLLSTSVNRMPHSSSAPVMQRSMSRPRLLQRPQMPRRGEHPSVAVRPNLSRRDIRHFEDLTKTDIELTSASKRRGKRRKNRFGGCSFDVTELVSLSKSPLSRCLQCRHDNSLRRLVTKHHPRFLPSGVGKYNVVRRKRCICGRATVDVATPSLKKTIFLDPSQVKHIFVMLDLAALFAFIAFLLDVLQKMLAL